MDILKPLFSYIELLRLKGVSKEKYEEQKEIFDINFMFKEKETSIDSEVH